MAYVEAGGNRQEGHEKIKNHALTALLEVKEQGLNNKLIEKLLADKSLNLNPKDIKENLNLHNLIGFSVQQVEDFFNP